MSKWKKDKLCNIADIVSGGTPSTGIKAFWNGDIPFVTPNDLSKLQSPFLNDTERKISKEGLESSSANLLPAGSLVMSSRAPIGYLAIGTKDFTTNQGCKSFRFYAEHEPLFHYYNLSHNIEAVKLRGEGTTFAEISKAELERFTVSFPEQLAEQQKIASILAAADETIAATSAAIEKYKAIRQGLLQDLFTRGVDVQTERLRPAYADAPHLYKVTVLGMVPVEWEVKTIQEVGKVNGRVG